MWFLFLVNRIRFGRLQRAPSETYEYNFLSATFVEAQLMRKKLMTDKSGVEGLRGDKSEVL